MAFIVNFAFGFASCLAPTFVGLRYWFLNLDGVPLSLRAIFCVISGIVSAFISWLLELQGYFAFIPACVVNYWLLGSSIGVPSPFPPYIPKDTNKNKQ